MPAHRFDNPKSISEWLSKISQTERHQLAGALTATLLEMASSHIHEWEDKEGIPPVLAFTSRKKPPESLIDSDNLCVCLFDPEHPDVPTHMKDKFTVVDSWVCVLNVSSLFSGPSKDFRSFMLRGMIQSLNADAYVLCTEGWAVDLPKDFDINNNTLSHAELAKRYGKMSTLTLSGAAKIDPMISWIGGWRVYTETHGDLNRFILPNRPMILGVDFNPMETSKKLPTGGLNNLYF